MKNKILLNLPTKILTPRLILRPPQAGDGIDIHNFFEDCYEDVIKWLNQPSEMPNNEYYEVEARTHSAEWILRNDMRLLIIEKHSNKIIGRAGFPPDLSNWEIPYFNISYTLARTFRGNGYVTEAVNAMTRLAFTYFKARRVEIKCDAENLKSIGVPERLKMNLEAVQCGIWPRKDQQELAEMRTYAIFNINELPTLEIAFE